MRYITFLRGINVGGQRSIKMVDLRNIFESLNFKNVKTYLQSGNVVFDYESSYGIEISNGIEKKINEILGLSVNVIIRTDEELRNIINNNPFVKKHDIEFDKLYVTIMLDKKEPNTIRLLDIKKEENEKFLVTSTEVYLYCPNGYGRTKLSNNMWEKKLNTVATTRNWRTINALFQISSEVK